MTTYVLSIIAEGKDNASGPLGRVASALSSLGTIAGGILTAGLIQNVGQNILDFGKKSLEATAQMQAFNMGLSTLVAREMRANDETLSLKDALGKAAPIAGELANQLRNIAIVSPYELGTVQETFRLAMAFGFTSKEAAGLTKGILNMASGVGATNEMLSRMSYNFAQIRLQGKVTAVDIRQLALAGFDLVGALKGIGEAYGIEIKNHEDFNRAIAEGKLTWQQFAEGFEKYADENFGGAAERMSRTLQGLKSTFNDLFLLTMPKILGPAAEKVTSFLGKILDKFIEFSDSGALDKIGEKIGGLFDGLEDAPIFKVFDTWESETLDTRSKMLNSFRLLFGKDMAQALNLLLPSSQILDQIYATWTSSTMDTSSKMLNSFRLLFGTEAVQLLVTGIESLKAAADGVLAPLLKVGQELGPIMTTAFANLLPGLQNFADFFMSSGPGILASIQSIFGTLVTTIGGLAAQIIPWAIEQFNKISEWFVTNGPLIEQYMGVLSTGFAILGQVIIALWAVIEPLLTGIIDLLLQFVTYWMQIFTGDLQGAFQTLLAMLVTILTAIWTAVVNFLNMIAGFMGTSLAQIGQVWSNNWNLLVSILQQISSIIINTIATFMVNVYTSFVNTFNQVTGFLSGLIATMRDLGKQLMQGLYDGIASMIEAVISLAKKVAGEIAKAFAVAAKIKSPSQVFFGFGENIVKGLANGIKSTGLAVNAIVGTAGAVSSAFTNSASPVAASGGNTITINIDGSGDPEAVAQKIFKLLKAQGATA